ncbi:MAG: zinc-dependent metalloprotease [Solirubrobacteraceae bacterium]
MPAPVIDWVVAEWIAGRIAEIGGVHGLVTSPAPQPRAVGGVGQIDLVSLAADAQRRVIAYTGLTPRTPIPIPEGITRRQWVAANIASTRTLLEPLLERATDKLGPGKGGWRLWLGVVSSTEIGLVIGYLAQRVLGQYDLALLEERSPGEEPRLLFVVPNLDQAVARLHADGLEFVTWVTLHEVTHAVQFGGVPWLREYLASLIRELMESAEQRLDVRHSLRLPRRADIARIGAAALHADLVGMVASESERKIIDRAQAVMAVIEGHAEHVMDVVAPELLPTLPAMRAALDERRQSQRGLSKLLARVLGLEMKLRQYAQGKAFCDALVAAAGPRALTHLFSSAQALPSLAEVEDPAGWLARNRAQL